MANLIAVTGGTGFIGRATIEHLLTQGQQIVALSRGENKPFTHDRLRWVKVDYADQDVLTDVFSGVDVVIHLSDDPNRQVNELVSPATKIAGVLTAAMKNAGVTRLILSSSIYARLADDGHDSDYGHHKLAIEQAVSNAGVSPIILRLPPVYGPGGGGGIALLSKLVRRNLPLPFGAATAPRAYLAISNLTDLMQTLIQTPSAQWQTHTGQIYEPADRDLVTTSDLVRYMAEILQISPKIIYVPSALLYFLGRLSGRLETVSAAFSPLPIRATPNLAADFNWVPPASMPSSLQFLVSS